MKRIYIKELPIEGQKILKHLIIGRKHRRRRRNWLSGFPLERKEKLHVQFFARVCTIMRLGVTGFALLNLLCLPFAQTVGKLDFTNFARLAVAFADFIGAEDIVILWEEEYDWSFHENLVLESYFSVEILPCTSLTKEKLTEKEGGLYVFGCKSLLIEDMLEKKNTISMLLWDHHAKGLRPRLDSNVFIMAHKTQNEVDFSELYSTKKTLVFQNHLARYYWNNSELIVMDPRSKYLRRMDLNGTVISVVVGLYYPWVYVEESTGEYNGIDATSIKNLARRLNFQCQWMANPDDVFM